MLDAGDQYDFAAAAVIPSKAVVLPLKARHLLPGFVFSAKRSAYAASGSLFRINKYRYFALSQFQVLACSVAFENFPPRPRPPMPKPFLMHLCARASIYAFSVLTALPTVSIAATQSVSRYQDQNQLIRAPQALAGLGSNLFGDKVNLYTGSLEFVQTDVSLPGNSSLPVQMGRRLMVGVTPPTDNTSFGSWDMDIPHLHGIFSMGWVDVHGNNSRCSVFGAPEPVGPDGIAQFSAIEFWHGNFIYVPGYGDQEMLARRTGNALAPGGNASQYPVVTRNNWQFSCLPSMKRGSGEGFLAIAPDGTKYQFDWMVTRGLLKLTKSNPNPALSVADAEINPGPNAFPDYSIYRSKVWILPTLITDRYGNTVTYTYDTANPWQLKSIVGNDASGSPRRLDLTYVSSTSSLISTVSDGTRIWRYEYDTSALQARLTSVILPDQSRWSLSGIYPLVKGLDYQSPGGCTDNGYYDVASISGSMAHPSGARGDFTLTPKQHGRAGVEKQCLGVATGEYTEIAIYPWVFDTYSLVRKQISGPGLQPLVWTTEYPQAQPSWAPCNGCLTWKTVAVTDPESNRTEYTFGTLYRETEGQLLQVFVYDRSGNLLRKTTTSYVEPLQPFGYSAQGRGDGALAAKVVETSSRVIEQQGVSFSWHAQSFNEYAQPTQTLRSSTLGYSRGETTKYNNNISKWVLGQVEQITEASTGRVPVLNGYNATTANLETVRKFGQLEKTLAYNADGTLYTQKDGKGQTTTYSNYKRGIPLNVRYADGTSESATVDNLGLLRSVTDAAGFITGYDYDAIGRLRAISYPGGDTVAWNPTIISYSQSPNSEFGLEPGHWRQQVTTGSSATTTYYDALWRPVYTERLDQADPGTIRVVRRRFGSGNKKIFESYPARSYDLAANDGVYQEYDALGRPTVTSAISELGVLYSGFTYVSGFQKYYTDARGNSWLHAYQAFDDPVESTITNIAMSEGVNVSIQRDIFGTPTAVTRSGGGKSVTRAYVYDSAQRLCKTIEPETKSTIQDYDLAGNVLWRAPGLALPSASCDTASAPAAKKISYGYDALNRLRTTTFGDGSPSISRTYTPDGLLATITSNGSTWTNTYNRRRLNEKERLTYGGVNYDYDRQYDANGSVLRVRYPLDSTWLEYSPNALGEARQIGSYATAITYHPNGAVTSFRYGNGIAHSMSTNRRGLPEWSVDAGVLQDRYTYDANGNVRSIEDWQEGITNRGLEYDNLNRLVHVNDAPVWGDAWYTYDALDNLTSSRITAGPNARILTHTINPTTNLLDSITNSAGSTYNQVFKYDDLGNVKQRGTQAFTFDLGNRLVSASGKGTYVYDGLGHRVSAVGTDGVNWIHVYSQEGQLLFVKPTVSTIGTKYIYLGNHVIAEARGPAVQYDHTDGLGSPIAYTDSAGKLLNRTRYEPYGATAAGMTPAIGYTGHVNAPELGLVYMQQRYYDPVAGRFLSADPVTTRADPVLNRYAYANNNPYKYLDKDGRQATLAACGLGPGGCAFGIIAAIVGVKAITDTVHASKGHSNSADPKSGSEDKATPAVGQGCIYCVPGSKTSSGKDYIGSTDDLDRRAKDTSDGRDRRGADVIDNYPIGDREERRRKEQQAINDKGGVSQTDNKRNEIRQTDWEGKGVKPPPPKPPEAELPQAQN